MCLAYSFLKDRVGPLKQSGSMNIQRSMSENPRYLRDQAARARRLAAVSTASDVIASLNALAAEYEERAQALETGLDADGVDPTMQNPMPPANT